MHVDGRFDENVGALNIDNARDTHVLEFLPVLFLRGVQMSTSRFLPESEDQEMKE
jgi:hypothetical protein